MNVPLVALGEVTEIDMGQAPKGESYNEDGEGYPLIAGASDFGDLSPKPSRHTSMPTKISRPGDIILCIRATIGDLNLSEKEYCLGRGVAGLRPKNAAIDGRYLWRVLEASADRLRSKGRGATFLQVSKADIAELEIPLPPLEEQKRIAGILDQADALRRLRARALDKLNTLGQAIFHEMFGDLRANDKGWEEGLTLGELAGVASGITKGRKTKTNALREVPYLAVSNVQDRFLKMDVVKTIEATEDEINRYRLCRDDILLTEGGDPDKLGRGTLWKEQLPECIHQNHVFRVRVCDTRVRPTFLSWLLGSDRGKAYFLQSAKQTTGIASINKTQINAFPLLLPPSSLQQHLEERLDVLEARLMAYSTAQFQSQALFASLQHRAFRGDL